MSVAPPLLVPAPTKVPARYGLASAADQVIVTNEAREIRNGIEWEATPCAPVQLDPADCDGPPTDRTAPDGIPVDQADPITVYAGFSCRLPGLTEDQIMARAAAALSTEWVAIEGAIWSTGDRRLMRTGTDATVELSPTPVSLTAGVGLLENYLGANYGGIGVLHAPRRIAAHAATAQLLTPESGRLLSPLGNRWSFGAGYPLTEPDGSPAATGVAWIVATGAVQYRRTTVRQRRLTEIFDPTTNEFDAIAERTYVISWDDCVRAAVPVTLT